MTIKNFLRLFNKLKQNDPNIFDIYEENKGSIDADCIFSLVQNYEYDNLGDIILEALYDSADTETDLYDVIKSKTDTTSPEYESNGPNILNAYFDDIKKVYNKYNNDYNINFKEDDREKVISMNTKTVITIAKRYQGFGLSLYELISAGNEGLIRAWNKFDPNRNTVKDNLMEVIEPMKDKFTWSTLSKTTKDALNYGETYKKFVNTFSKEKSIHKTDVIEWVEKNVKPASFNSVASFWITAEIKKALSNHTKGPEIKDDTYNEIMQDIEELRKDLKKCKNSADEKKIYDEIQWLMECAEKVKPVIPNNVRIDVPVSSVNINNGGEMDLNNVITNNDIEEDENTLEFEKVNDKNRFYDIIDKLFGDVKQRDKRVFMKTYGINYPGKLSVADIAQQEGISVARVSQIVNTTLETIKQNIEENNVSKEYLYSLLG